MNSYQFHADSWLHFLYTAPRFLRSHWWLVLLFIAGYFFSQYLAPQVDSNAAWYALSPLAQFAWYLSLVLAVGFPLGMTYAVLRFICLDDGVEIKLGTAVVLRFLAAYTIIYLVTGVGLLLIIPGLLAWTCTLLVPVLVLAHAYPLADAFYISFDSVKGNIWKITLSFLPIMLAVLAVYMGIRWALASLGSEVGVHLLDALIFPVSVLISASYTMTLYDRTRYIVKEQRLKVG